MRPDDKSGTIASVGDLLETAFVVRPDLRAAELAIEAAGERLGWEKSKVYNLIAIIDAEDKGADSLSAGPGLAAEIPVFNQGDAKIARAEAELSKVTRQYEAVRQRTILNVRQAHVRYVSAWEEFDLWDSGIVPTLAEAVERAQKSFEVGETTYLAVLEARLKLIDAQMRRAELSASLHRGAAEVNYCVGKRVI